MDNVKIIEKKIQNKLKKSMVTCGVQIPFI